MATSVEKQITRELARLRMWRDVANAEEIAIEDTVAHHRIDCLLNDWEAQHHARHSQTQSANGAECGSPT